MANDTDEIGDFQYVIETLNNSELSEMIGTTSDNIFCMVIMVMVLFSMLFTVSGNDDNEGCKSFRLFKSCHKAIEASS